MESSSVAVLAWNMWGYGPMAGAGREPIMEVWRRSPQRGPGGQRGAKPPWNLNTFSFWTFNGDRKFAHFSKIWKRKIITDICVVFAKMKFSKP